MHLVRNHASQTCCKKISMTVNLNYMKRRSLTPAYHTHRFKKGPSKVSDTGLGGKRLASRDGVEEFRLQEFDLMIRRGISCSHHLELLQCHLWNLIATPMFLNLVNNTIAKVIIFLHSPRTSLDLEFLVACKITSSRKP